jgi:hypothetical protein
VTDQADHAEFDELAAGHVLHALEPADEQRFGRHAPQCPQCMRSIGEFREVAAALAEISPDAEPSRQLGQRILAAASVSPARNGHRAAGPGLAGPARPAGPAGPRHAALSQKVVPLRSRRGQPRLRRTAAAAAAVLIAIGGVWAGLAASGGGPAQQLGGCAHLRGCSEVSLTTATTHQVVAKVVVRGGAVWLMPAAIPADNTADQIYVLWQLTGAHTLPVGSFDVKPGDRAPILIGNLATAYSGTWAFAISLEHGRTIPATPSRAMALGQVS